MKDYITVWFSFTKDINTFDFPMVLLSRNGKKKYHYRVTRSSMKRLTNLLDTSKVTVYHDGWSIKL